MRRILSIWLPQLAVERWSKTSDFAPDDPVVLTFEGTHGPIIHAVTQAAAERGAIPPALADKPDSGEPGFIEPRRLTPSVGEAFFFFTLSRAYVFTGRSVDALLTSRRLRQNLREDACSWG